MFLKRTLISWFTSFESAKIRLFFRSTNYSEFRRPGGGLWFIHIDPVGGVDGGDFIVPVHRYAQFLVGDLLFVEGFVPEDVNIVGFVVDYFDEFEVFEVAVPKAELEAGFGQAGLGGIFDYCGCGFTGGEGFELGGVAGHQDPFAQLIGFLF